MEVCEKAIVKLAKFPIHQEQSRTLQESQQNQEHLQNRIQSLEEMARNGESVNKVNFCCDTVLAEGGR